VVVVGFPVVAPLVTKQILQLDDSDSWWQIVERLPGSVAADGGDGVSGESMMQADADRLRAELTALKGQCQLPEGLDRFKEWVPEIARFSFLPIDPAVASAQGHGGKAAPTGRQTEETVPDGGWPTGHPRYPG
jgi:hypothetical protein